MYCIEKVNIALEVKLPDFILIDVSGYVDIYEIKTPGTKLLRHDRSRGNYYWSSHMGMAISQVENYLDALTVNKDKLRNIIKDKYKFDLRVVRPRGYVIAGLSSEYKAIPKKSDDFRLLNESLRNVEILPYDIFLYRFGTFSEAIKAAYLASRESRRDR